VKLTVLGSGYVGLVTAAGLAEVGHQVACVDIDPQRVATLNAGGIPFYEPGLAEVVARARRARRLTFGARVEGEHTSSDVYFIAVGTPPLPDGRADLSAVLAASRTIAAVAEAPAVVAVKSTVPVGTGDKVEAVLRETARQPLTVASNPEFLKEGAALEDFRRPDRVIIGVNEKVAEHTLRALYRPLQLSSERLLVMDRRSSELAKYAANAMLALRISFMNELSRLCDRDGGDIHAIRRALGSDHRIGPHFLYAGPGYGGSCFPKDVSALAAHARDRDQPLEIVEAAARANDRQRGYVIERLRTLLGGFAGKTVALWGLAFKPETDDVRDAPAAPLVQALLAEGATVRAHDPEAAESFKRSHAAAIATFDNEYDALDGADALVVMTEWRHFRDPDFDAIRRRLRAPRILDARNIWTVHDLRARGFDYLGIGTLAGRGA
jgi:UDPglucose 6-dehydrogenase